MIEEFFKMFLQAGASFWLVCCCWCAAGGQRRALHQRQPVRGVRQDSHRAHAEESLPAGAQLYRGAAAAGGRERETGERARTLLLVFKPSLLFLFLSFKISGVFQLRGNYDSSYLRKEKWLWHMHQRHTIHHLPRTPTCNDLTKEHQTTLTHRNTLLRSAPSLAATLTAALLKWRFNDPVYVTRVPHFLTTRAHTLESALGRLDDDMLCFPAAVTGSLLTGNYTSRLLSWPPLLQ